MQEFAQDALYRYIEDGVMSDVAVVEEGLSFFCRKESLPMAWTIQYSKLAERQRSKLLPEVDKRIRSFMEDRVANLQHPKSIAKKLSGAYEDRMRYRVGTTG